MKHAFFLAPAGTGVGLTTVSLGLFNALDQRGVRVFKPAQLAAQCSCSRPSVTAMLKSFPQDDRDHMVKDGVISVTISAAPNTQVAIDQASEVVLAG